MAVESNVRRRLSYVESLGAYGIRLGNVGLEESLHFIGYQIVGLMAVYNVLFARIVCKMYVSLLEDNLYKVFLLIVPEAWEACINQTAVSTVLLYHLLACGRQRIQDVYAMLDSLFPLQRLCTVPTIESGIILLTNKKQYINYVFDTDTQSWQKQKECYLSIMEWCVISLSSQGKSEQEIFNLLCRSVSAIKKTKKAICYELEVRRFQEAIQMAQNLSIT